MAADFPERDWKVFRELRVEALERFCERVLGEIAKVSSSRDTAHERYLKVFEIVRSKDKELARLFDDLRRSTAWDQLCMIKAAGLLSDEEMSRFSVETQDSVRVFVAHLTRR